MHRVLRPRVALAACLALACTAALALAADSPFKVARKIHVGGEGGWDDLTAQAGAHRVFLSHGTAVEVVDVESDSVVGRILDTPGVHGIALAPDLNRGWTSNGRDSSVTVFDLKTLATTGRIKVPARNPDAILFDAASIRVFTFNGGSQNTTAIDANTGQVLGSVALGGRPEFAQVDGAGRLYVNLEDSSKVVQLDTHKLAIMNTWALGEGQEPSGLAIDRSRGRLFVACANEKCVVLDFHTGKILATLPIGKGVDGIVCDGKRGLVFSSNGQDGTMTVIATDAAGVRVLETVPTQKGARTVTCDLTTGEVYTPTAEFGPPPAPTPERPHPRPSVVPGSFTLLVVKR